MLIPIDDLSDAHLSAYRNLKDRELVDQNRLIAEGEHLVRRLLASTLITESVMVSRRRLERIAPIVPDDVPLYVVEEAQIHQIIGFRFHSGIIAVGYRPKPPELRSIIPPGDRPAMIVVMSELISAQNVGGIIRLAAGFGADGVMVDSRCVDPFYRLAVRTSMGACFSLPIVYSRYLLGDLSVLQENHVTTVAACLSEQAIPLHTAPSVDRVAIVLGNEAQGLSQQVITACNQQVTIPMRHGTDSLNVANAAGIFMYHFARR